MDFSRHFYFACKWLCYFNWTQMCNWFVYVSCFKNSVANGSFEIYNRILMDNAQKLISIQCDPFQFRLVFVNISMHVCKRLWVVSVFRQFISRSEQTEPLAQVHWTDPNTLYWWLIWWNRFHPLSCCSKLLITPSSDRTYSKWLCFTR